MERGLYGPFGSFKAENELSALCDLYGKCNDSYYASDQTKSNYQHYLKCNNIKLNVKEKTIHSKK